MTATADRPRASRILHEAWSDLRACWLVIAGTALLYTAVATIILLPLVGVLFQFLIARTHSSAIADVDIPRFLLSTAPGVTALLLVSALIAAVTAIEQACLMSAGLAQVRGISLRVRDAFAHAAARAPAIFALALLLVIRVLVLLAPFVAVIGATYWALLRRYDINYYLVDRPGAFWASAAIMGTAALGCAMALGRVAVRWILCLPLVVFERRSPRSVFDESARRMRGHRYPALLSLCAWALLAFVLPWLTTAVMQALGRLVAPAFGESMGGLLSFVGVIATAWLIVGFAGSVVVSGLYALISVHWYLATAPKNDLKLPRRFQRNIVLGEGHVKVPWLASVVVVALAIPVAAAVAYLLMQNVWADRPVLVLAHRGASYAAPENTLAAFRRAGVERADFVELDVQESSDGVVMVAHDSDLMKVARKPLKIWSSTAAQLQAVDIGSYFSSAYADQRMPTLAEALAACKGSTRVDIELKNYGHDQRLEERVIGVVEAAGMQEQVVTMSLSGAMVARMKRLRPDWSSGLLIARAVGDVSRLRVDFLAVESKMAGRELVRTAHAAGKPVYVWTVNDAQRMIRLMGLGVDGLITDRPALAREVVANYATMSSAQRLFLFVMTRLGVREEISEPELRP